MVIGCARLVDPFKWSAVCKPLSGLYGIWLSCQKCLTIAGAIVIVALSLSLSYLFIASRFETDVNVCEKESNPRFRKRVRAL